MRIAYLHGFLGEPSAWDAVATTRTGSRPALPGHGGIVVEASWDANLAAIGDAVGACDVVVGYSLGARVAAGLVIAGAVPRAVLIGVNPGIDDRERATRRASDAAWAKLAREAGITAFVDAWEAQPLLATQARVAPERRSARRSRRLAHDPEELARSLEVMGLAEMPDYRAAIDDRFALIAGAEDSKYVAIAHTLQAPLELIPEAGHDPTFEQPSALAGAVGRALDRWR